MVKIGIEDKIPFKIYHLRNDQKVTASQQKDVIMALNLLEREKFRLQRKLNLGSSQIKGMMFEVFMEETRCILEENNNG